VENKKTEVLPILPLKDIIVYPHMVIPLFIGKNKHIPAITAAMNTSKQIFLVAQKDRKNTDPTIEDLYSIGTVANLLQLIKLPDNTAKVLIEGLYRGKIKDYVTSEGVITATIEAYEDVLDTDNETVALGRMLVTRFEDLTKLNTKIPEEIVSALDSIEEPGRLADTIAIHLQLKTEDRQKILEEQSIKKRLILVLTLLESEVDMLKIEGKIQERVKHQIEEGQKAYYLSEKIKAIKKELGEDPEKEKPIDEIAQLEDRIKNARMNKDAEEKALAELNKLKMMPLMSAEATVIRVYLDWLVTLPWHKKTTTNHDLHQAKNILEEDHYGLEKIKDRILEYLAVQNRADRVKGPILCFVGPPGVGKTSLGKSIARATGREFIRVALGGVRDEAEIRGHRRTYIGSQPGKILQKMAKVKVCNPLFMLDEIDKMSADFRGDPSSALLEVLDPEQNHAFNDHYLEVDYDLSNVMFITTANSLDIPYPLLDRMEIIPLEGYTEDEKLNIAVKYLVPKQISENGLKNKEINFSQGSIIEMIRYYTREAGVRNLERAIAKVCRKVVKEISLDGSKKNTPISRRNIEKYLGVRQYRFGLAEKNNRIGQVTGLAWTEVGGDLLTIEVAVVLGKGNSIYTGSLGEVMLESIQAAITVVRSRSEKLGISTDFYTKHDIHVHVPEGATPKDGPSAGIGMCTAIISALTKIPVRADVAMTGEITLRGEVLPIGGLKEKLLAALRGGIKTVIIPAENQKDLKELPKNITSNLNIKPVKWIDEVLSISLEYAPKPLKKLAKKPKKKTRKIK
jgi:ATP-dependent Lon protease